MVFPETPIFAIRREPILSAEGSVFTANEIRIVSLYSQGYDEAEISVKMGKALGHIRNMVASRNGKSIKEKINQMTGWSPNNIDEITIWMYGKQMIPGVVPMTQFYTEELYSNIQIQALTLVASGISTTKDIANELHHRDGSTKNIISDAIITTETFTGLRTHRIGAAMTMVALGYIDEGVIGSRLPAESWQKPQSTENPLEVAPSLPVASLS